MRILILTIYFNKNYNIIGDMLSIDVFAVISFFIFSEVTKKLQCNYFCMMLENYEIYH